MGRRSLYGRNFRRTLCALLVFMISSPTPVHAQKNFVGCSLESCINIAFSRHPLLKSGEAQESAAEALLSVKKAEWIPSMDIQASVGRFEGEQIAPFTAVGVLGEGVLPKHASGRYYQTITRLQIPLFKDKAFLGQTPHAVRQAEWGVSRATWENQSLRLQVASQVAEAYVHLLKAQKAVKTYERIVASRAESYNLSEAQFRQHLISKKDLLTEEVRLTESKRDLSLRELQLRRSREALTAAMGLPYTHDVEISEIDNVSVPLQPVEERVKQAHQENPVTRAQRFKIQENEEAVEQVKSEYYPVVSIMVHYGFADDLDDDSGPPNDQWIASLQIRAPLFDFVTARNKAHLARAQLAEERMRLLDFELRLEQQIRDLDLRIHEREAEMRLLKKQIEQTEEAVRLNEALFRQKMLSSAAVHETKADLLKLQLDEEHAVYDQFLDRYHLQLLSEWKIR